MQTFLPLPDFNQSAHCLDMKRLGKQRSEVIILFNALLKGGGWSNHPAAKMWRGYELALMSYGLVMCREWVFRGYKDTCFNKIVKLIPDSTCHTWATLPKPPWLGDEKFHSSHRSNLLRKDPVWYSQFGWKEDSTLPYVWPV